MERVALGLLALGIAKGDRVGNWSQTCVEWTILQFATARVGAILVNVNPAYRTGEFRFAAGHSGMRLLVTAPSFKTSAHHAMIDEARADLPALERVVTIGTERASGTRDLLWSELRSMGHAVAMGCLARTSHGASSVRGGRGNHVVPAGAM